MIANNGTPTRLLDGLALASLNGAHARIADRPGAVARYLPDVSGWIVVSERPSGADRNDVRVFIGSGAVFAVGAVAVVPAGWETVEGSVGVQLIGELIDGSPGPEAVELTPNEIPEMTDLVARTKPGPFLPRTIELGRYIGIRRKGRLVAMAGERLHPPGWTEISAVSTDEAFPGQRFGRLLVLDVTVGIRQRGEVPFMHAAAGNIGVIGLYQHFGFRLRDRGAPRLVRGP